MRKHETFILTPIASILKETQFALAPLEVTIYFSILPAKK